jgi:hypothetical protein
MIFGIHPAFVIAGVGLLIASVLVFFACRARSGLTTATLLFFALVVAVPGIWLFLEFHPELFDGRYRTYKAFYRDIQLGMTRDEVFATIQARYPQNGNRQRPKIIEDEPGRLGFLMNRETSSQPHCEGIFLSLMNGRVMSKTYSPDL